MENGRQFRINLYTRGVGEQVALEIQRGDKRMTLRVAVAERESDPGRLSELVTQDNAIRTLGVIAIELTPRIAALLPPLRRSSAVIVARVSADTRTRSRAASARGMRSMR